MPHLHFGHTGDELPNVLRFGLEPEDVTRHLNGIGAHAHTLVPLTLTTRLDPPGLPAYGRLLPGVPNGDAALSIRGDEAEEERKGRTECWYGRQAAAVTGSGRS